MSITQISGVRRRRAQGVAVEAAVQGSSALWADPAEQDAPMPVSYAPRSLPTRVPSGAPVAAPAGGRARVRALPVAVPLRRRPVSPVRSTARQGGGVPGVVGKGLPVAESASPTSLWEDVRPWGSGVRVDAAGTSAAGWSVRTPVAAAPPAGGAVRARPATETTPGVARPGRSWVAGSLAAVLAAGSLGAGLALGSAPVVDAAVAVPGATQEDRVAVAHGETLWGIAASRTPSGSDVRETARVIAERNALRDGQVAAGQVLVVPAVAQH